MRIKHDFRLKLGSNIPANTRHWSNLDLMLGQRRGLGSYLWYYIEKNSIAVGSSGTWAPSCDEPMWGLDQVIQQEFCPLMYAVFLDLPLLLLAFNAWMRLTSWQNHTKMKENMHLLFCDKYVMFSCMAKWTNNITMIIKLYDIVQWGKLCCQIFKSLYTSFGYLGHT